MSDRTLQAETNGGLSFAEGSGVYEASLDPSNLPTITSVEDSDHVFVSDAGTPSKVTKANLLNGVGESRWTSIADFNDHPPAQNQITTTSDLTSIITPGAPIKYTMASQAETPGTFYGICHSITSTTLTIRGPRLETDDGDLEALWVGRPEMTVQVDFFMPGTIDHASSISTGLATYAKSAFRWLLGPANIATAYARVDTADSSNSPYIGIYLDSAHMMRFDYGGGSDGPPETPLSGTSWTELQGTGTGTMLVNKSNCRVERGDDLEIWIDNSMGDGDSENLTVSALFVLE